jgi:hypothetical protein
MSDEGTQPNYRFARAVSTVAPKPGHDLATASFQLGDESFVLHVVEGPAADSVGFIGVATNFDRSRVLRFALHGSLIERVDDLPRASHFPTATYRFRPGRRAQASDLVDLVVERAIAVFSNLRAANGIDPEAAMVAYELAGGERVSVAITGYQRGWYWDLLIIAVAFAIAVLLAPREEGVPIEVAIEQEAGGSLFEVSGSLRFRESLTG